MDKPWCNTEEELDEIPSLSYHHKPELYLKKYNFPQDILLDFFCSERMAISTEDYYYNDMYLDLIRELQPHIDADKFLDLWLDLDHLRELELFSQLIIQLIKKRKPLESIGYYIYELIDEYIHKYLYVSKDYKKDLCEDFIEIAKENRYSIKHNLYKGEEATNEEQIIELAERVSEHIPYRYSTVLPI